MSGNIISSSIWYFMIGLRYKTTHRLHGGIDLEGGVASVDRSGVWVTPLGALQVTAAGVHRRENIKGRPKVG